MTLIDNIFKNLWFFFVSIQMRISVNHVIFQDHKINSQKKKKQSTYLNTTELQVTSPFHPFWQGTFYLKEINKKSENKCERLKSKLCNELIV